QFYYIFLVLPSIFGITLIGEGIYKVSKEEWNGLVSIVLGLIFIAFVIVSYFMFTTIFPS
ncbi:hypothetical protein KJ570_02045, partial [Patescibacteria group bacterium]|nr:hypothetical protein [Patescibacteria group bacterium]